MIWPLFIIRPEPGNSASVAAARGAGLDAYGFPMFEVVPLAWSAPAAQAVDALLVTSANAARHAGPELTRLAKKPAYAVGEASAAAAREAGLTIAHVGNRDVAVLLAGIAPAHRRLLHLAGWDRAKLIVPPRLTIAERIVYASEPLPMPGRLALLLLARALPQAVVALHSARAATHFRAECAVNSVPLDQLRVAALSPAVLAAAGGGWARAEAAVRPDDDALLVLAARLCQA